MSASPSFVVEGRTCGSCTACCRIPSIRILDKPAGKNCVNCVPLEGCTIYETRPQQCRDFYCGFMVMKELGEEWRPSTAGFIVAMDAKTNQIRLLADPEDPDAWRRTPYIEKIKDWSRIGLTYGTQVLVFHDEDVTVVLPDREVAVGRLASNEVLVIRENRKPGGVRYDVAKLDAEDPEAIANRRPSPFDAGSAVGD